MAATDRLAAFWTAIGSKVERMDLYEAEYRAIACLHETLAEFEGRYTAHWTDVLTELPKSAYDFVVMNPPFANSQDIAHVLAAWKLVAKGGTLVAIMGEGAFFRQDAKAPRNYLLWIIPWGRVSTAAGYAQAKELLPTDWLTSIQALERSGWARDAFGAEFLKVFLAVKRAEYRQFMGEVGEQDWRWYLSNA